MDVHPTIGPKIRWYRQARGCSVRELGRRSGVPFSLISRYERAAANPTYANALRLAKALGVGIDTLWDHTPAPAFPVHPEETPAGS